MAISLCGLDVSFLMANPLPPRPIRRRADINSKRSDLPMPGYMADIRPFVSPVGDNPMVISSRKQLRDHENAYSMKQAGNDLVGKIVEKNDAKLKARQELAKGCDGDWA